VTHGHILAWKKISALSLVGRQPRREYVYPVLILSLLSPLLDNSVDIVLGYGLDGVLGFDSRQVLGIFLFTTASRAALGPTRPPNQRVSGAFSL
jgi:hypothetical protein